jgi:hypothetical protein
MKTQCVDQVVGDILASWRYDISGIFPEMRGDYEAHFLECEHCRSRRRLHRTIDIVLIFLATVSAFVFLLAFAIIRYLKPQHAFILEVGSLAGFALSALIWLAVAVATPAPIVMVDAARVGARRVHERLPEKIRDRIPEEIWVRIAGE